MVENAITKIVDEGLESLGRYYSTYRAVVVNNDDPKLKNRLKVAIPGIHGGMMLWALPKGQCGTKDSGFKYITPKIGDTVYISFEFGDPSMPLWEYHGWAKGEAPIELTLPDVCGFVTPGGIQVIYNDEDGSLNLYLPGEANIVSDKEINVVGEKVIINGGLNGGMVKIQELTNKLNKTIQELESLRLAFNTHTHGGVTTGPGISAIPVTQYTSPFSSYNKEDYEDTKFTH